MPAFDRNNKEHRAIAEQIYYELLSKTFEEAADAFAVACRRADVEPLLVRTLAVKYAEEVVSRSPAAHLPGFVERCLGLKKEY